MSLLYYKKLFTSLNVNANLQKKEGGSNSPNKPLLLLSVLQAIELGILTENKIYLTEDLIELFVINWKNLHGISGYHCKIVYPFFRLRSDGFWNLVANYGYEDIIKDKIDVRTYDMLNKYVDYAKLNDDLFELLQNKNNRLEMVQILLKEYFKNAKTDEYLASFEVGSEFYDYNYQSPEQLRFEFEQIEKLSKEAKEEETKLRDARFARNVINAYGAICSISELKVTVVANVSMLDACHILPFKESYNNNIENGFALCPNLHRAFDRGLIAVDNDYKVIVSNIFKENEQSNYSIRQFEGKKLLLPNNKLHYPKIEYFKAHKERFKDNFLKK